MSIPALPAIIKASRQQRKLPEIPEGYRILSFDPGHTTGWAFFEYENESQVHLGLQGQIKTQSAEEAAPKVNSLIDTTDPGIIVVEDYRVYSNKRHQHVGSELVTSQVIGTIKTLASLHIPSLEVVMQPAGIAKSFCVDKKLKAWGLYQAGERHCNDAIRHGCHFMIFGIIKGAEKRRMTGHNVG